MALSFILMNGVSYIFWLLSLMGILSGQLNAYLPGLLILFSFPHFVTTYWIWKNRIKNLKAEWWAVSFPLFYLLLFYLSARGSLAGLSPQELVRFSYYYLIYHFAQQLYGVTLWQAYQLGLSLDQWSKGALRAFFLSCGFYSLLDFEVRGTSRVLFYHPTNVLNIPGPLVDVGFAVSLFLSAVMVGGLFYQYFKLRSTNALLLFLPVSLAWLWFIPPFNQSIILFLPVIHALQYFPFIHMKERHQGLGKLLVMTFACILLGWFFFRWLPFLNFDFLVAAELWPVMILTLLNNHHFIIDGRIWKLRDPDNRALLNSKKS